ncbi:hypothetical protein VD0004_g9257 [Verticillium dahliae]|nr:hypothetical protein VD0004_g9257 [Verticillium dahliae]PNH63009.1 hypothetical protein VD0001_g9285 [Verticillium dahliae]
MAARPASSAMAMTAKRCTRPTAPRLGLAKTTCPFSTTSHREKTSQLRNAMYQWMERTGRRFEEAPTHGTKYLGQAADQPFPLNPLFRSPRVLDESMREEIFKRVTQQKLSLKAVSADLGVDIRRVAAVVRLKTLEKQWEAKGKQLAKPYSKAILGMVPTTTYNPENQFEHEPIHEIDVHKLSQQQLFVPTSESRAFTREDAAEALHRSLLPVDKRAPHTQLIELQKATLEGVPLETSLFKFKADTRAEEDRLKEKHQKKVQLEMSQTSRVDTKRFEYRFQDVNVEVVGKTGRGHKGVGARYGVPFDDRKRGRNNVPLSVP